MPKNVKNTTFIGLLDLLAPHSCRGCGHIGSPLCNRCKNYIISHHQNQCPVCHTPNSNGKCRQCRGLPPIFIAGERSDLIGDLVHALKYDSLRALAHPLAEILDATLPPTDSPTIIVPLPTISRHVRERGLDHTQLITKHFARLRPHYTVANFLIRTKDTVQVGSSRTTRLAQATTAYQLKSSAKINPTATYVLFDDVWTTGASLQSAYRLLREAGAQRIIISALALSTFDPQ